MDTTYESLIDVSRIINGNIKNISGDLVCGDGGIPPSRFSFIFLLNYG